MTTGIIFNAITEDRDFIPGIFRNLGDFIASPGNIVESWGGDSTTSWLHLELELKEPIVLKYENDDRLRISINDNLSGLTRFNVNFLGGEEYR